MNRFLQKIGLYLALMLGLSFVAVWLPDYGHEGDMLYALKDKHVRLAEIPAPRLIFIGGSNLLFGLDSEKVEEAVGMPVVNLGLHAGTGLRFMMNHAESFAGEGDIIVVVPEYAHFYDKSPATYDGQDELLTTVLDVDQASLSDVSLGHFFALYHFMPNYVGNKYFNFFRFLFKGKQRSGKFVAYEREKFNRWGDVTGHLAMENQKFAPTPKPTEKKPNKLDPRVLEDINTFSANLKTKGARAVLLPTCYQDSSFINNREAVIAIGQSWDQLDLPILAQPERYVMPHHLFWDSPEHLNREGREVRTRMLIEDLAPVVGERK